MSQLNQTRPNREDMTWGAEGDLGGYMLTAEELERATAIVEKQSGYDLYTADQLSQQEIESASAQYHVEQDMEAMAARIDQLLEENAKLEQLLTDHKNWLRIANDQWSKADENLTNYMVKVALTP